jgi:hypothetical protein
MKLGVPPGLSGNVPWVEVRERALFPMLLLELLAETFHRFFQLIEFRAKLRHGILEGADAFGVGAEDLQRSGRR